MAVDEGPRRYAKGAARRREILEAALALIAERGYSASSLQEIADAVGISKAGVLHYFDSREALIAAVLEERDAHSAADYLETLPDGDPGDMVGMLLRASSRNADTPGLVALYSRVVVDAAGVEHPAHAYIAGRYARVVGAVADQVRALGVELPAGLDPDSFARVAVAVSDGLQLQWSYRPEADMRDALERAIRALSGGALPLPPAEPAAATA
ncbi:TetR/AcrR family transcriptional regulator [Clavibacter sp. VKM Ac-2873]|uniref:TetR/AcrR family transcriptional regulator n=1 Tax=Clavibacter sp. VKM Ac-2873 TaxID=2783813 RepID=UPI00188B24AF|nr:TetR/AcrR family transcriptional regulator [Clavibacter sp. VKM Ac-2873]MBF4617264.1 TetR/AcrR family transcriptional regulator [Clavibacter sp. VKM Ac-2873]